MDAIAFASVTKTFPMNAQRMLVKGHVTRLLQRKRHQRFVALRNITFRIPTGQTVGVVGANGAGKSTLLSMVAGLCPPDEGTVTVQGRVAPLLQLGAGFHPDLTGIENLHLNAALLGLSAEETEEASDRVIEFADVGSFIDQPLRTYSSGMVLRLAFSIAIHVEPDILIIDEVLTVGDQIFQEKCLSKIMQFKDRGGTLLFVSHSTGAVQKLCERALWLDQGELLMDGDAAEVTAAYEGGVRVKAGMR